MNFKVLGLVTLALAVTAPADAGKQAGSKRHFERGRGWERMLGRLDKDGDSRISRNEFQSAEAGGRFDRLDKDGDGSVTRGEVEAVERERMREHLLEMFTKGDTDTDGLLSAAEIAGLRAAHFDRLDTDGDGYLTAEESGAKPKGSRERP